jgi:hypothetical protein
MHGELLPLKTENLHKFDGGRIQAALDQAIRNAVRDLVDRPGDPTTRKITLTINLTPECDAGNNLEAIETECHVTAKYPCYRVRANKLSVRKLAGEDVMIFNPEDPDVRQKPLDFGHDDE